MKWYKKLYLSEKAKDSKYKVFWKVKAGKVQKDTFLITLSDHSDNVLDIYSANVLLQPHCKQSHVIDNIYVVGLAMSYDDALLLVQDIIGEVYANTGGFKIREYLRFGL